MPEVSSFFGIRITIYFDDHLPPHFHARYQSHRASVGIKRAEVIAGALPAPQLKLVLAWAVIHREELLRDWELTQRHQPPVKIEPLA
ncbi:MAG: DUF4160 domain-containing protein [Bifidobacteriaceae bacterium]|jgi:hypothetical protein|nr:DUF4160 domain-containing protein [Bifidobacteriaceae bacterium]